VAFRRARSALLTYISTLVSVAGLPMVIHWLFPLFLIFSKLFVVSYQN
jgi:hypothetical protein